MPGDARLCQCRPRAAVSGLSALNPFLMPSSVTLCQARRSRSGHCRIRVITFIPADGDTMKLSSSWAAVLTTLIVAILVTGPAAATGQQDAKGAGQKGKSRITVAKD